MVGPESGGRSVRDEHQKTVFGEPAEATGHHALRGANGSGDVSGCGSGVHRDVREDRSITTVAALHQVLAEQPGRAYTETQCRGKGAIVFRLLRAPRVQGAERQEDGGSEAGGSKSGVRQMCLLESGLGGETEWDRVRADVRPVRRSVRRPAPLR